MVKEAIDVFIQGELWPKAKRCAAEMAPKYVTILILNLLYLLEVRWPHGSSCACLWIEQSGFQSWARRLCCVRARHFTLTVSVSIQVYKWILANSMLEGNPAMD